MRKLNGFYLSNYPIHQLSLILLCCLTLFSCQFQKGMRAKEEGRKEDAKKHFQKAVKHKVYGTGAEACLERLKVNETKLVSDHLEIEKNLNELEQELGKSSHKKIIKLKKKGVTRSSMRTARENLQERIFEKMVTAGTVEELTILEGYAEEDYWRDTRVDTIRKVVINRTINPEEIVFGEEADETWKARTLELSSPSDLMMQQGRSCLDRSSNLKYQVTYEEATTILRDYIDVILPQNYHKVWAIKSNIWEIFQTYHPYCEMDSFQVTHPYDQITKDRWYEEASIALCEYNLPDLLQFHKGHPHTALDLEIAQQIVCLSSTSENLDKDQQTQIKDIISMFEFVIQLNDCKAESKVLEILEELTYFANEYEGHKMVFQLTAVAIDHYIYQKKYDEALMLVQKLRPLFKDVEVATPSYAFQNKKQEFFDQYEQLLTRAQKEKSTQELWPVTIWNTPENDEYGLVSWGETAEVFFTRKNPKTKEAHIMTSNRKEKLWSKPTLVSKLSIAEDVEPLSMSGDGRMILLKSGGKLFLSNRKAIGRAWSTPEPLPMPDRFVENAWISPNDSLILLEYYDASITAFEEPSINTAIAQLMPDGTYGQLKMLRKDANYISTERKPIMALDGRMLFYVSNSEDDWGNDDMYSIRLKNPYAWEQMDAPLNIGLPMNTLFNDEGVTYLSEYTGFAYFHKEERCGTDKNLDIWKFKMSKMNYPAQVLRLAGIVLDENETPIRADEGFMEFTPDYQLKVHYEPISSKGTYSYTVQDSTTVVRLFPEVPGYYSEQESKHFLANAQRGEIIRDTFRLTSFDYIRKHFKLVDCTFYHDQAIFDQPSKTQPELNRLAKIATRMGANLELVGHTDQVGTTTKNKQLSLDRAQAVKDFLVNSCGFPAARITIYGKGASEPICDNDTEEGRRCNRRVEVKFEMPELEKRR